MKMKALFVYGAAMAMCAVPAFAQTTHMTATSSKTTISSKATTTRISDPRFVEDAAQSDLVETQAATLAKQKASSPSIKTLAQRVLDDNGKADNELKPIATKVHATWPTALNVSNKAAYDRLSKLSGTTFDRAYVDLIVKDHRAEVSEFKTEAAAGKEPDAKAFASKTLPTLEDHLKTAQEGTTAKK